MSRSDVTPSVDKKKLQEWILKRTSIAFTVLAIFFIGAAVGIIWLKNQTKDKGVSKTLRKGLNMNEGFNALFFSDKHLAENFPFGSAVKKPRVNGDVGMDSVLDTSKWQLRIVNFPESPDKDSVRMFTMDDIKSLPKVNVIFDFKCIEGWNEVTWWSGCRLIDFMKKFHLGTVDSSAPDATSKALARWVGFVSTDSTYFVGIDMKSAVHPQTILCYEMNGKPLPSSQGAPLRLIIPVKYGIKHIKRIGTIRFTDKRPNDYWWRKGYDYDAAL